MMDINWLFEATIESSLLIAGLLVLNPILRRLFNAQIPYLLWVVPLLAVVIWKKPERPMMVLDSATLPDGQQILQLIPNPDILFLPAYLNPFLIWLIGLVLYCLFRFVSWYRLQGLLNRASEHLLPKELIDLIPEKLKSVNARFYLTDLPSAPFVTGLLKPTIYLPDDFYSRFNREQQKWVITHELTHIRRLDLWSQCLAEVFRAVFWFNPLLYIAWPNFQEDQELACDYHTLKDSSLEERRQYGSAMMQGINANLLPATMAFFTLKKERFIMLQKHKKSKAMHLLGVFAGLAIGFFTLTEAPRSIAVDKGEWIKMNSIKVIEFISREAALNSKSVVGLELVPEGYEIVDFKMDDDSWDETSRIIDLALSCKGLSFDLVSSNLIIKEGGASDVRKHTCLFLVEGGYVNTRNSNMRIREFIHPRNLYDEVVGAELMPKPLLANIVIKHTHWIEAYDFVLSCRGFSFDIAEDRKLVIKKDLSRMDKKMCDSIYYPQIPKEQGPNKEISLNFSDSSLRFVLIRLAQFIGKNAVVKEIPRIKIRDLAFEKIVWREAFESLVECHGYQYKIERSNIIFEKSQSNAMYDDRCLAYRNPEDFLAEKKAVDPRYKDAADLWKLGFHSPSREFRKFLNHTNIPQEKHNQILNQLNNYKNVSTNDETSSRKFNLRLREGDINHSKSNLVFWSYSSQSNIIATLVYAEGRDKIVDIELNEDKLDAPIAEDHDSYSMPLEAFTGTYTDALNERSLKFSVKGENLFVFDKDVGRWLRLERRPSGRFGFRSGPHFKVRDTGNSWPVQFAFGSEPNVEESEIRNNWPFYPSEAKDVDIKGFYHHTKGKKRAVFDKTSYYYPLDK